MIIEVKMAPIKNEMLFRLKQTSLDEEMKNANNLLISVFLSEEKTNK